MPKYLILTITLLSSFIAFAQNATVTGTVTDDQGTRLPGAYIRASDGSKAAITDTNGRYSIDLEPGRITLIYSFVGAQQRSIDLVLNSGDQIIKDVQLLRRTDIGTAIVEGSGDRKKPLQRIEPKVIVRIPSARGTIEDLLLQAPVNFTSELSSSYNVRGGNFDENLVYVNDIQVYRPFLVRAGQQEGLSFPNPDMVDNIYFSAGGFEAKYGDRMSSVLDISYRKPSEFRGSFTGSLLGGSLQIEDINEKRTFSHNSGVRYRNNSYVLGSLDEQGEYRPTYFDFQTYMTFKPKPYGAWSYSLLGNISRNRYNFIPQSRETNIGNINEALRLTINFQGEEKTGFDTFFGAFNAERLSDVSRIRFIASAFRTQEFETFDILGIYSLDELERDLGSDEFGEVLANRGTGAFLDHARNYLDATVLNFTHTGYHTFQSEKHKLEWGIRAQYEQINDELSEWSYSDSVGYSQPHPQDSIGYEIPDLQPDQEINLLDVIKSVNEVSSIRSTAYVQNTWNVETEKGHEWDFNVGLRGNHWSFNNQFVGGPRANMAYTPNWYKKETIGTDSLIKRDVVFTLAGGMYWQPVFYREMRGIFGELNPDIRAQRSIHIVAGVNYLLEIFDRPFKFVGELYYKDYNYLIPYEVENVRLRYYATNNAVGFATGADFMLNGEFIKGIQSWMRLSVLRTAEDLIDDQYYEYINSDGVVIRPGFTLNDDPVDSNLVEPGFIPRPTDQRVNFSMLFQDEMRKWPEYKVLVSVFYGTGLPYGPPDFQRYRDILRTTAYRRVDIGFSRDLATNPDRKSFKWMKDGFVAIEIFNILDVNNTINHTWIEDVNGAQRAIPNFLTGRRINLKVSFKF